MIASSEQLAEGSRVRSTAHGFGSVILDQGPTVVVRFDHGIEECDKSSLFRELGPIEALDRPKLDIPLDVINRFQAEAIRSVNDSWGVFSRSRIELLPHQLWVCRRVSHDWPTRWLIADDVGLGKTIEAGMILWPLLASGRVKRLLIIVPAHLVEQWQYRLRSLFDIRVARYFAEADTEKADFWGTHTQVVASLQTLRLDREDRRRRLLEAGPWDLLIVDEAHHLNSDEEQGPTLGYRLIRDLGEAHLINSMLFFTGTPHRGKNFGFLSLLHLLRPDLFDPKKSFAEQLPLLANVMIRNNKSQVTDLKGRRLFLDPRVASETYEFSGVEHRFYELLSQFILEGRAYASSLESSQGRAVMLVLVAMQKLASSSIAAIARAIERRLDRVRKGEARLQDLTEKLERYRQAESHGSDDELGRLEEEIAGAATDLRLIRDEEPRLRELLTHARAVERETKLERIVSVVSERFSENSVLFFTEYKATQAKLMTYLMEQFGEGTVAFINGDHRLDDVEFPDGRRETLNSVREDAAEEFNVGRRRFLISTEAAGEGIDLQESCHVVIHVDLPWNPMRLHQRVGRLNRYGQRNLVEVLSFRNPDTVESLIWERLNEKLQRITQAFGHVMDEPEDLLQLVLGMASPSLFRDLFAEAPTVNRDSLSSWFDEKTAQFGGSDAVEIVRSLVGNAAKFNFQDVCEELPRVDLPDLRPFFEGSLALSGRRIRDDEGSMSFLTPDEWRNRPGVLSEYRDMRFDRADRSAKAGERLLGVGHKIVDRALAHALQRSASLTSLPEAILPNPLIVFLVRDRVTESEGKSAARVAAVELDRTSASTVVLRDWQLLKRLNLLPWRRQLMRDTAPGVDDKSRVAMAIDQAQKVLVGELDTLDTGFQYPQVECVGALWPVENP